MRTLAVDRGHIDAPTQRRFHCGHGDGYVNIVAHPLEELVLTDLDDEVEISRSRALGAGIASTCQPDALPIARSWLDPKLQRLAACDHTRTFACRAGILHLAGAATARALDIELHPAAHLRHLAAAVALRALHAAALDATSLAGIALLLALDLQAGNPAADSRPEVDLDLVFEVGSRLRSPCLSTAVEHSAEDVPEAGPKSSAAFRRRTPAPAPATEVREVEPTEVERHTLTTTATARLRSSASTAAGVCFRRCRVDRIGVEAKLVVDLALLFVTQDVVRLRDLFELLFGLFVVRVYVRMVFARQLPECLAHLVGRGGLFHAKRAVVVLLLWLCHKFLCKRSLAFSTL